MSMRFFSLFGLCLCFAISGCDQGQPSAPAEKVAAKPSEPSVTKTPPAVGGPSTFLFLDGRYVRRPFVLTITNQCLFVNGESIICASDEHPTYATPSSGILKRIIADCESGEVVFLKLGAGSMRISRKDREDWEQIVNVVRILDSDLAAQYKLNTILKHLETDSYGCPSQNVIEILRQLVENYRPDPQLDERMRELTPKVHIPLWSPPEKAK